MLLDSLLLFTNSPLHISKLRVSWEYPRYVIVVEAMKMSVRTRPGPMQLIPNFILGLVRYSPMHTIHIGQLLRYAIV